MHVPFPLKQANYAETAVPALVALLGSYDGKVQHAACLALAKLANSWPASSRESMKDGIGTVAMSGLVTVLHSKKLGWRGYSEEEDSRLAAAVALSALVEGSADNAQRAIAAGVVPPLVAMLTWYGHKRQAAALLALMSIYECGIPESQVCRAAGQVDCMPLDAMLSVANCVLHRTCTQATLAQSLAGSCCCRCYS